MLICSYLKAKLERAAKTKKISNARIIIKHRKFSLTAFIHNFGNLHISYHMNITYMNFAARHRNKAIYFADSECLIFRYIIRDFPKLIIIFTSFYFIAFGRQLLLNNLWLICDSKFCAAISKERLFSIYASLGNWWPLTA